MKPILTALPPKSAQPAGVIASTTLMGQSRELRIQHGSEEYRLRLTRNGKLILTK